MQAHRPGAGPAARAALVLLSMAGAARGERLATAELSSWPQAAGACGAAPLVAPVRHDESLHFDRHGRLVERAQRLTVTAGSERIHALLRYRYDAGGRLLAAGLPDGSELRYTRGADGQALALRRRLADTPFSPIEQWLVRDVQRLAGVRRLTFGDGSRRAVRSEAPVPEPAPGVQHVLHDIDGRRLADLDARGRMTRLYVWLDALPVALIDFVHPRVPDAPPDTLPERIGRAIAAMWRWVAGDGERVRYLPAGEAPAPGAGRPSPTPRAPPADSATPPAPSRRRPWTRSPR